MLSPIQFCQYATDSGFFCNLKHDSDIDVHIFTPTVWRSAVVEVQTGRDLLSKKVNFPVLQTRGGFGAPLQHAASCSPTIYALIRVIRVKMIPMYLMEAAHT